MLNNDEINKFNRMRAIVNASIHPDTGEIIPWVMRMPCFVHTNLPIITGMLCLPVTPASTIFWQWLNQTYNAGMNFGNRNATSG